MLSFDELTTTPQLALRDLHGSEFIIADPIQRAKIAVKIETLALEMLERELEQRRAGLTEVRYRLRLASYSPQQRALFEHFRRTYRNPDTYTIDAWCEDNAAQCAAQGFTSEQAADWLWIENAR